MDGNGETTIFHVKIWNHPIDSQPFINGCLEFQVHLQSWLCFHYHVTLTPVSTNSSLAGIYDLLIESMYFLHEHGDVIPAVAM